MIAANDTNLVSWIDVNKDSDFPIQNLPFGIFKTKNLTPRACVAIGDKIMDLFALSELGYIDIDPNIFNQQYLNSFIELGKVKTRETRESIASLLNIKNSQLQDNTEHLENVIHKQQEVEMLLPVFVRDYTDFYSSREHATNVGTMFRDPENALLPNWLHLPVGYHGRASSIIVSGQPVYRPKGQTRPNDDESPIYGPSKLLDFELEMAFITHPGKPMGESISTSEAEDYIFGMVILNDWSARDIQKWEYQPLGPFLAKSFASSISPWVVTLDALEPYRITNPEQDPTPLPYLQQEGKNSYDINLEVYLQPEDGDKHRICKSNYKYMYWSMAQQLAHHTINGCNINAGDMYGSGTISGSKPDSLGSMLELAWKGTKPIQLPDGSERKFLLDGDSVTIKAWSEKGDTRIGFGEVRGKVLPAL